MYSNELLIYLKHYAVALENIQTSSFSPCCALYGPNLKCYLEYVFI